MPRVGLIQFAHLNSVRVPNKIVAELRPGLTMLDLGLRKMKTIGQQYDVTPMLAVSESEPQLIQKAQEYGIETLLRTASTVYSEKWDDAVAGIKDRLDSRFDQIVDVNLVCRPFLRVETIGKLCSVAHQDPKICYTSVRQNHGVVWDNESTLLVGSGEVPNTKTNPAYYDLAHVGQVYPIQKFYEPESAMTSRMGQIIIDLRGEERLDTDYPADLALAQKIWPLFENQYI